MNKTALHRFHFVRRLWKIKTMRQGIAMHKLRTMGVGNITLSFDWVD